MFKVTLLAALLAVARAVPLSVTQTLVLTDHLSVGDMRIQYVAFIADFNQPIYFKSANGTLTPAAQAWNTTIPGMTDMPASVVFGYGASNVVCPNSAFNNRSSIIDFNAMNNGPPLGLLTAPSVEEPVAAFINSFAQGVKVEELSRPERFAAVTLFGWPDSPEENAPYAFTNCNVTLGMAPPPGLPMEAQQMLHNISDAQGNAFVGNIQFGSPVAAPPCTYAGIDALLNTLGTILDNVNLASNQDASNSLQLTIALWQQRSAFIGCASLLNSFFDPVNVTRTTVSTQCNSQYGTLEWASDPCCNYQARRAQCCLPRTQNQTIHSVGNITSAFQQCRHPKQMSGLLQAFTTWKQSIDTLPSIDTSSVYNKLTSFRQDCYNDLWNKQCSSDSDCYSGKCNSDMGRCEVPFGQEHTVLVPCFIDRMDPQMKVEFESMMDLPVSYSTDVEEKNALISAFQQNYMIDDCVGPKSYQYRRQWRGSIRNDDGTWSPYIVPGNQTGCLAERACNYQQWPALTENECLNSDDAQRHPHFCAVVTNNAVQWPMTRWSQCYADIWNVPSNQKATVCAALNGTIDQWNGCVLPDRNTSSTCQYNAAAACTPTDRTGCSMNACYSTVANSADCDTLYATAQSSLSNVYNQQYSADSNVCLISLQDVSQCANIGLSFTTNTWFNQGNRETPEQCLGYCDTPPLRERSDITAAQCAQQRTCTKNCGDKCRSNNFQTTGVCIDSTATQQNCTTGQFSWNSQKCYYNSTVDATACNNLGKTWFTCESLNSTNSCQSNPYSDILSCFWDRNSFCDNEQECTSHGSCSDWQYQNWNNQTAGVCEVDIVYDLNNQPTNCPQNNNDVSWYGSTCIFRNITEPSACTAFGGVYKKRASTASECAAHGSGCLESGFNELTPKNSSLCSTCGGQIVPQFNWISGQWHAPEWVTLNWVARNWSSVNSWAPTINDADISLAIDSAASRVIARSISIDYNKRYKYYSQILKFVACDCTSGAENRGCFGGAGNQMQSQAAKEQVVPGVSRQVGPVTVLPGTFAGNKSVSVTVYTVPSFQFQQSASGSRLVKRTTSSDYTSYAVVKYNGQTTGQLLGDAYTIQASSQPSGSLPLCLTIDTTIPTNPDWTKYDIGSLNNDQSTWAPLVLSTTVTGTQLCGNVTTTGTFAPILRAQTLPSATTPSSPPPSAAQTTPAKKTSGADRVVIYTWFPIFLATFAVFLI